MRRARHLSRLAGTTRGRASSSGLPASWLMLQAASLGAALMYLLDPRVGRRRRALLRDRLVHAGRVLERAQRVTARDLSNRAAGVWAAATRPLRDGDATDREIVERVRAKLGRYVSHPRAIQVAVHEGRALLSGPILSREVGPLLRCVRRIQGVREIEDRLEAFEEQDTGHVSSLQGGTPRPGERSEILQDRWAPATRLLAGTLGGGLLAHALRAGGLLGIGAGALGSSLILRAATNRGVRSALRRPRGIDVQKTLYIAAPVDEVFAFWADYGNFPHFMSRVREVRPLDDSRSRWVVSGPGGVPVQWTAHVTRMVPGEAIEWESDPGSAVCHSGKVRFEPAGDGTRVDIRLRYTPPAGMLGHAVASLFGADPKSDLDADLVRVKTLIETGRPPRDAAQPLRKEPVRGPRAVPPASAPPPPSGGHPLSGGLD